jgi:hypothetical protein
VRTRTPLKYTPALVVLVEATVNENGINEFGLNTRAPRNSPACAESVLIARADEAAPVSSLRRSIN